MELDIELLAMLRGVSELQAEDPSDELTPWVRAALARGLVKLAVRKLELSLEARRVAAADHNVPGDN